jgi:hypothetical protein
MQTTGGTNNAMNGQYAARMSEDALRMQIDRGTGATRKWVNALVNGIKRTCEILVQTIPPVYDTKQQFMILGQDGSEEMVTLNDEVYDTQTQTMVRVNTLNKGEYKVFCDAGPAFANKMEAGLSAMLNYAAIDPSIVNTGGDLMLKSIDAPLMDEMAARKRAQLLQAGMIPEDQMTDEEIAAAQQAAQQPQPEDPAVMLERMKEENIAMSHQNKSKQLELDTAKAITEAEGKGAKLQSDILTNARKLEQNQEKINNDAKDKFMKNAIAIAELEFQTQQEQNANITANLQTASE